MKTFAYLLFYKYFYKTESFLPVNHSAVPYLSKVIAGAIFFMEWEVIMSLREFPQLPTQTGTVHTGILIAVYVTQLLIGASDDAYVFC